MKIIALPHIAPDYDTSMPPYHMVADSSLAPWRKPLYLPDFDKEFTISLSPVMVLSRLGKSIPGRFAHRYYNEGASGFLVRAEGMYRRLLAAGLPVSPAVSFDLSAMISPRMSFEDTCALWADGIIITVNGCETMRRTCPDLTAQADLAIEAVSRILTVKTGDVFFLDLPERGITIAETDRIAFINARTGDTVHEFTVK